MSPLLRAFILLCFKLYHVKSFIIKHLRFFIDDQLIPLLRESKNGYDGAQPSSPSQIKLGHWIFLVVYWIFSPGCSF